MEEKILNILEDISDRSDPRGNGDAEQNHRRREIQSRSLK